MKQSECLSSFIHSYAQWISLVIRSLRFIRVVNAKVGKFSA